MQSRSRAQIGLLAALVAASAILRLLLIAERPLWFDEFFTIWAARLPLADLVAALRLDSGPPGYYLLVKPFAMLADRMSDGGRIVRVPSFIAALLLFVSARSLPRGAARSGLVLLFAASLLINLYSGEARPYALLALLCLALFRLALDGPETRARLCAVAGVAALALYTHYLAILAVASVGILAVASRRRRSTIALAAGAFLFLPWLPLLRAQPAAAVAWMRETAADSIVGFLSALGGVGRVPAPFGPPAPAAAFLAGAVVGALGLVFLIARGRTDRASRDAAIFSVLVLGGALGAGVWKPVAFAGRTELAVLPVWLWALGRAIPESRPIRLTCIAGAVLGLGSTLGMLLAVHAPSPPAAVVEILARVANDGDVVVAAGGFYLPARLASEQGRLAAKVTPLTSEVARHPGWFVASLPGVEEERQLAAAAEGVAPGKRLFLVTPPAFATPGLGRIVGSGGHIRELMRTPDALVILWTRAPA